MAQDVGLLVQSKHKFEINTDPGGTSTMSQLAKGFSGFEVSNNEESDQTQYLDGNGFATTTVMGAQMTLSFSGHRYYGDVAQDWIFGQAMTIGVARETDFTWTLPNGDSFDGPCTVAVIEGPGGDANAKGEITVEIHFNGKPVFTPAV